MKIPVRTKQRKEETWQVKNTNFFMPARDEGRIPSLAHKHKNKSTPTRRKLKNPEAVQPALQAVFDIIPEELQQISPGVNPLIPTEQDVMAELTRFGTKGAPISLPPKSPTQKFKKDNRKLSELI